MSAAPPGGWLPRCRRSGAARSAARSRRRGAGSGRAWSGRHRRRPRCGPWLCGKWISTKFATLGVTSRPSLPISSVSQAQPAAVVRDRRLDVRGVLDRGDAGLHRRRVDVERPAHAVERIDDMRRPVHPAEAQRGEAVDLGEGAASSRRCRRWRPARCRPRSRCAARIRHRPRRARAARCGGSARVQALDLVERHIGAGRVVRVGDEDDACALGSPP